MPQTFEFRLHISGPELERDFTLPQGETLIGREPSIALPLVYPLVSRRHARLDCTESACTITDLESANGTIVNGVRINPNEPYPLKDGMHLSIGPFEITCSVVPTGVAGEAVQEPPVSELPVVKATVEPAPEAVQPVGQDADEKTTSEPALEAAPDR